MVASVATIVTVVSALVAVAGLLASVYTVGRSDHNAARDEALALAEVRRQTIVELEQRVRELERALAEMRRERVRNHGRRSRRA